MLKIFFSSTLFAKFLASNKLERFFEQADEMRTTSRYTQTESIAIDMQASLGDVAWPGI